jgi:hypothetical protein
MICQLPAAGKGRFRFAICEAIDEVEEFFACNRAAAFIADFRNAAFGQGPEAIWFSNVNRQFSEMDIVVVTAADMPSPVTQRDNIAQVYCNDDRIPTTELLARLIATAI